MTIGKIEISNSVEWMPVDKIKFHPMDGMVAQRTDHPRFDYITSLQRTNLNVSILGKQSSETTTFIWRKCLLKDWKFWNEPEKVRKYIPIEWKDYRYNNWTNKNKTTGYLGFQFT